MVERFEFYDGVRPQTSEENTGRLPHARKEGAEEMTKNAAFRGVPHDLDVPDDDEFDFGLFDLEVFRDENVGVDHLFIPEDKTGMALCGEPIQGLTLLPDADFGEMILCGECEAEMQRINTHEGEVGAEKVWECRNCSAWGTDRQSGVDHSVDRGHGIRNLKEAAGPISPQQMAVQNVQHSQAPNAPQQNQQPVTPPGEPQKGPPLALVPSGSGEGEDQRMRHTVPPELPNNRYYMASREKKSSINGRFSYKVRRK